MPSKLLPPDKISALILAALSITLKTIFTAVTAFLSLRNKSLPEHKHGQ